MSFSIRSVFTGLVIALAGFVSAEPARAQASSEIDRIVAIADESVILASELNIAVENILKQYSGREAQLPPRDILERQVLERLIIMKLQVDRAESSGIRIADSELLRTAQSVAGNAGMTLDQMKAALKRDGFEFESYLNTLREEIMVRRLQQRIVQSRVLVSESEIDQYLAKRDVNSDEVQLANILVALPDGANAEQIALASKKIEGIYQLIKAGTMDFRAAAIRYSDDRNALDGGDLGWRDLNSIPSRFGDMIRGMQKGQVTEPVRGPSGFQLVQMVDRRTTGNKVITEYQADSFLIRVNDLVSDEQAKSRIDEFRRRIISGEDFATLAKQHSDDEFSRSRGGRLDWFEQNAYGSAIGTAVPKLADGDVSMPIRSDVGWHLIRRVATRERDVSEENRRELARQIIGERKSEEEYERFLRQLRSEAFIESRLNQA